MTRRLALVVTGLAASCEAFTAPPTATPAFVLLAAACACALWILLIPKVLP